MQHVLWENITFPIPQFWAILYLYRGQDEWQRIYSLPQSQLHIKSHQRCVKCVDPAQIQSHLSDIWLSSLGDSSNTLKLQKSVIPILSYLLDERLYLKAGCDYRQNPEDMGVGAHCTAISSLSPYLSQFLPLGLSNGPSWMELYFPETLLTGRNFGHSH